MAYTEDHTVWVQKGATLSDKSAQKEFGLRHEDIRLFAMFEASV